MITAFGAAWPVAIVKSWKSKTTKGKSLLFLFIVELGYIAGIIHKALYSRDIVIIFYIVNFAMVVFDTALYFRNKKLDSLNKLKDNDN